MPFMRLTAEPSHHQPHHRAEPDPVVEPEPTGADRHRPPQLKTDCSRSGCVCAFSREPATAIHRNSCAGAGERDPFQPGPVQYSRKLPGETLARGDSSDTSSETSIDDHNAAIGSELGSDDTGRMGESMEAGAWGSGSPADSMLLEQDEASPPGSGLLQQTHLSDVLNYVGGGAGSPNQHLFAAAGYPPELSIENLV